MARIDIPLRDLRGQPVNLQLQALTSSIIQLRADLATHNHQVSGLSGGSVADHIVSSNLNLMSRTILKDFEFSPDDYSGAFKTGNIQWSSSTGIVSGGTGILINKYGIVGALDGSITFSITTDGSATFVGTITGSTITGGTFQTSSSGKRVVIAGADNSLRFYDSTGQIIGIGTDVGKGIQMNLNSTTNDAMIVNSAVAGSGFTYVNTGVVANRGLYIEQSGVGAGNNLEAIRIKHSGSSYLILGNISGTGQGIYIDRGVGSSGATFLTLSSTNSTAETDSQMLYIYRSGTVGGAIGLDIEHSLTSSPTFCIGIRMTLASGSGAEQAFRFDGLEIVSAAVGGDQDKKIRISIAGTTYYIPCHTA